MTLDPALGIGHHLGVTTVDDIREQLAAVPLFARCQPSDLREEHEEQQ